MNGVEDAAASGQPPWEKAWGREMKGVAGAMRFEYMKEGI